MVLGMFWVFASTAWGQLPRRIEELGLSSHQRAFRVGGEVVWMDGAALRRDFPELVGLSDEALRAWILRGFCYVTEAQLALRGNLLPEFNFDSKNFRTIFHPDSYHRSSVAAAEDPNQLGQTIGLVDLKGTGWGSAPLSDGRRIPTLLRLVHQSAPYDDTDWYWLERGRESLKSEIGLLERDLLKPSMSDRGRTLFQRSLRIRRQDLALLNLAAQQMKVGNHDLSPLVSHMKKGDYYTGSAELPRLLKEVIAQKTLQYILDRTPEIKLPGGSMVSTVDNYFVIALPWSVTSMSEKARAGILGRRAHWGRMPVGEPLHSDTSSFPAMDRLADLQHSRLREVVDFENVGMTSPEFPLLYSGEDGSLIPPIDDAAKRRVRLWEDIGSEADLQGWVDQQLQFQGHRFRDGLAMALDRPELRAVDAEIQALLRHPDVGPNIEILGMEEGAYKMANQGIALLRIFHTRPGDVLEYFRIMMEPLQHFLKEKKHNPSLSKSRAQIAFAESLSDQLILLYGAGFMARSADTAEVVKRFLVPLEEFWKIPADGKWSHADAKLALAWVARLSPFFQEAARMLLSIKRGPPEMLDVTLMPSFWWGVHMSLVMFPEYSVDDTTLSLRSRYWSKSSDSFHSAFDHIANRIIPPTKYQRHFEIGMRSILFGDPITRPENDPCQNLFWVPLLDSTSQD